jgi:hypothetical protein
MASIYLKPEFFIIGERKCGTSSLYRYLLDHPAVLPCKVKEPQFLSRIQIHRWVTWRRYQALFPIHDNRDPVKLDWYRIDQFGALHTEEMYYPRGTIGKEITGEASANTFTQVPPRRLRKYFPEAKPVLLLRDPASRAYAHYRMLQRFHAEGRRFPFKLTTFEQDVRREMNEFRIGKLTYFVGPGVYLKKLKLWVKEYENNGVHVIFTENLNDNQSALAELNMLTHFLNIEEHDFSEIVKIKYNTSLSSEMPQSLREELNSFYRSQNNGLSELLDKKLPWE